MSPKGAEASPRVTDFSINQSINHWVYFGNNQFTETQRETEKTDRKKTQKKILFVHTQRWNYDPCAACNARGPRGRCPKCAALKKISSQNSGLFSILFTSGWRHSTYPLDPLHILTENPEGYLAIWGRGHRPIMCFCTGRQHWSFASVHRMISSHPMARLRFWVESSNVNVAGLEDHYWRRLRCPKACPIQAWDGNTCGEIEHGGISVAPVARSWEWDVETEFKLALVVTPPGAKNASQVRQSGIRGRRPRSVEQPASRLPVIWHRHCLQEQSKTYLFKLSYCIT